MRTNPKVSNEQLLFEATAIEITSTDHPGEPWVDWLEHRFAVERFVHHAHALTPRQVRLIHILLAGESVRQAAAILEVTPSRIYSMVKDAARRVRRAERDATLRAHPAMLSADADARQRAHQRRQQWRRKDRERRERDVSPIDAQWRPTPMPPATPADPVRVSQLERLVLSANPYGGPLNQGIALVMEVTGLGATLRQLLGSPGKAVIK